MEWLAEDSVDIRHRIQIEHVDFYFACLAHPIPVQFLWSYGVIYTRDLGMQISEKM